MKLQKIDLWDRSQRGRSVRKHPSKRSREIHVAKRLSPEIRTRLFWSVRGPDRADEAMLLESLLAVVSLSAGTPFVCVTLTSCHCLLEFLLAPIVM